MATGLIGEATGVIFADLQYDGHYSTVHDDLVALLRAHFPRVDAGHQGDSWIWVYCGSSDLDHIAIDTFSAMTHQVKADRVYPELSEIVRLLQQHYTLTLREPPEPE